MGINIDFVKVARNHLWLLQLGLVVGLALGYALYRNSEAMYRSSANVQIVEPSSENMPVDSLETGSSGVSLTDQALVMRSERILERAVELGNLAAAPEFSGRTPEQIAGSLAGNPSLVIEPAVESAETSVLRVQFDSTDPKTTQRVVQSIVDAYAMHLQSQYTDVGRETIDLIESAREDVHSKLSALERDYAEFKRDSGLIFRENSATSVHRENAEKYLQAQQELQIEKAHLDSVLAATREAIRSERPLESVLMGLTLSSRSPELSGPKEQDRVNRGELALRKIRESTREMPSERMRRERLLPLKMERNELLSSVGPDHPAMVTLDKRIELIEQTVNQVADSEREIQSRMDSAWSELDDEQDDQSEEVSEEELREAVRTGVYALQQRLKAVEEEARVLGEAYERESKTAKTHSEHEIRSAQFVREIDRQQDLYDRIMARLDEVNLMRDGATLKLLPLDRAKSGYRFAPSLFKLLLMGGFFGVVLAGGLACLHDLTDRSYHSPADIADHLELPVIGHVPMVSETKRPTDREPASSTTGVQAGRLDARLCSALRRRGRECEAFRAIRTAVFFSDQARDRQILQVTSATPGEGKSLVAANLAITIAQSGRSVLLIDGDLRRNRVDHLFGIQSGRGLAWAINEIDSAQKSDRSGDGIELAYREAIRETAVPNLSVIVSGNRPSNPSELLSSESFEMLLQSVRGKFDVIVVDTPPLLAVSDPSNVVRRADGVLLVVRLRKGVKPDAARAAQILRTLGADVLGVVVNGIGGKGVGRYTASEDSSTYRNRRAYRNGYGYAYGPLDDQYGEYYEDETVKSTGAVRTPPALPVSSPDNTPSPTA